jgi:hypothetical protein
MTVLEGSLDRRAIYAQMRSAFEETRVWDRLEHDIEVARYTRPGDPLKIDCGYRSQGKFKMFHAVSLRRGSDPAKILAYTFSQLCEGMLREEKIKAELTAVVEDDLNRADESVAFAMQVLAGSEIVIAPMGALHSLAATARHDLLE